MSELVLDITHSDRWHAACGPFDGVADTVVFHNLAPNPCVVWFEENTFGVKGIALDPQSTFRLHRQGSAATVCHVGGLAESRADVGTVTIPDLKSANVAKAATAKALADVGTVTFPES
jgi:hypothetical protein